MILITKHRNKNPVQWIWLIIVTEHVITIKSGGIVELAVKISMVLCALLENPHCQQNTKNVLFWDHFIIMLVALWDVSTKYWNYFWWIIYCLLFSRVLLFVFWTPGCKSVNNAWIHLFCTFKLPRCVWLIIFVYREKRKL